MNIINENNPNLDELLLRTRPLEKINRSEYVFPDPLQKLKLLQDKPLSLGNLLNWKPCIFDYGESFQHVHPKSMHIKWVAKKGFIQDWAIYYGPAEWSWDYILAMGTKLTDPIIVQKLVNCDFESFQMYRR